MLRRGKDRLFSIKIIAGQVKFMWPENAGLYTCSAIWLIVFYNDSCVYDICTV